MTSVMVMVFGCHIILPGNGSRGIKILADLSALAVIL